MHCKSMSYLLCVHTCTCTHPHKLSHSLLFLSQHGKHHCFWQWFFTKKKALKQMKCPGFHCILLITKQVQTTNNQSSILISFSFLFSSHCLVTTWEELMVWGVTLPGVMQVRDFPLIQGNLCSASLAFFFSSYKLDLSHSSYYPCRQDGYPEQFSFQYFRVAAPGR